MRRYCFAMVLAWSAGATGADGGGRSLDIGGLMFGDLYYVPGYHDADDEDAAGLVVRRGYLTFDADLGERWSGRLRFETNQSGEFEQYYMETDVKDLYLRRAFADHEVTAGLAPTPTFDLIEDLWGLRYLARTPMDLQGLPSRDVGVGMRGPVSARGGLSYRVMAAVDSDFSNDSSEGRKFMTALTWRVGERWTLDLYADHESLPGSTDRRTLQGFVGFAGDGLRWGLQYSDQDREDDPPVELASVFVVVPWNRRNLVLRADHLFEPSPRGDDIAYLPFDPSATATMVIAGIEFRPRPRVHVAPNVVVKRYGTDETGRRPDTDVHLRLTVFLDFE